MIHACRRPTRWRFGALGSQASHVLTSWVLAAGGRRSGPLRAVPRAVVKGGLLRVQLDDQLFLHRGCDLPTLGPAQDLGRQPLVIGLEPRRDLAGQLGGVADDLRRRRARVNRDHVGVPELVAGDVDPASVHRPVAVQDQLPRLAPRGGEAQADQDVVKSALQHPQEVLAGHALLARRLVVVDRKLLLQPPVVALGLLLLPQLDSVLALLLTAASVVTGRVGAALNAALVGQTALALEEQLLSLPAALLALCTCISSH